ncbi:hypothetical protein [Actibacterium sp. 188UL27-1]|uniref:hypothetical protein n=1 Tax=Actibacterium sp. 188UL27-1 TaxID=2786961 RepID=UPI00195A5BD0|nr:hypothetical protein [Actibacterium sp. 188UL27-1]MBM7069608.1 hypothetical protein [Actibacterium sp. 188UL27-1]
MTYTVIVKRYAPFTTFGGGYHGDGRNSAKLAGSARTWGFITFDLETGVIKKSALSSPTWKTAKPEEKKTQTPRITVTTRSFQAGKELNFTAHTEGSNPMVKGSPDIDTFIDIRYRSGKIDGCLRGDDFPNAEVFLVQGELTASQQKTSPACIDAQELCHFQTKWGPNRGPFTRLFGAHAKQFLKAFNADICI